MASVHPIILAGGSGTRLWPLSTPARPKHLLDLLPGGTLLEQTLARVAGTSGFSRPTVVCNAAHAEEIKRLAPGARLIVEPEGRNSAPAIALAALAHAAGDLLLVLPSDHHIGRVEAFLAAIERGEALANDGWLVTFGVQPDRAETGYGYIAAGGELTTGAFAVERFVEKPDPASAERMVADGRHHWNAGIFLFRAGDYLDELARYAPEIEAATRAAFEKGAGGDVVRPDPLSFANSPATSIDYAVMERSDRVAVVPVDMAWSDIGSWAALQDVAAKDAEGNAVDDGSLAIASSNCLIRSTGPRVAAVGIDDVIVVATADAVLVTSRAHAQQVREVAERLGQDPPPAPRENRS